MGGVTINNCIIHVAQHDLPFGGVGAGADTEAESSLHNEVGFDDASRRQGRVEFYVVRATEVARINLRDAIRVLLCSVDDVLAVGAELEAAEHAAARRQGRIEFHVARAVPAARIEFE